MSFFSEVILGKEPDRSAKQDMKEIERWMTILSKNSFVQTVLDNITAETIQGERMEMVHISPTSMGLKWIPRKFIEANGSSSGDYATYGLENLTIPACGAFAWLIYYKIKSIDPNSGWEVRHTEEWRVNCWEIKDYYLIYLPKLNKW